MVCFFNKVFIFILFIRCILLYVLFIVIELGWSIYGFFSVMFFVLEGELLLKVNFLNLLRIVFNVS